MRWGLGIVTRSYWAFNCTFPEYVHVHFNLWTARILRRLCCMPVSNSTWEVGKGLSVSSCSSQMAWLISRPWERFHKLWTTGWMASISTVLGWAIGSRLRKSRASPLHRSNRTGTTGSSTAFRNCSPLWSASGIRSARKPCFFRVGVGLVLGFVAVLSVLPADTRRYDNVLITWKRRHNIVLT